jgi:hypothetical protein
MPKDLKRHYGSGGVRHDSFFGLLVWFDGVDVGERPHLSSAAADEGCGTRKVNGSPDSMDRSPAPGEKRKTVRVCYPSFAAGTKLRCAADGTAAGSAVE